MIVQELIDKLNSLSEDQKQMKIGYRDYVYGWVEMSYFSEITEYMYEKKQVITLD